MATQASVTQSRRLKLAEVVLLILPALLFIGLALHFRNQETARRDVKRAIVGKWQRQDRAIIVFQVQGDQLLANENGYQLPDKRMSFRVIDDNHFQIIDNRVPQLHWIVEVVIYGDKMVITDNGRPPSVVHFTRIKTKSNRVMP